jgi:hypothetical protein
LTEEYKAIKAELLRDLELERSLQEQMKKDREIQIRSEALNHAFNLATLDNSPVAKREAALWKNIENFSRFLLEGKIPSKAASNTEQLIEKVASI